MEGYDSGHRGTVSYDSGSIGVLHLELFKYLVTLAQVISTSPFFTSLVKTLQERGVKKTSPRLIFSYFLSFEVLQTHPWNPCVSIFDNASQLKGFVL